MLLVVRPGRAIQTEPQETQEPRPQQYHIIAAVAVAPVLLVVRPGRATQTKPQETQEPNRSITIVLTVAVAPDPE